MKLLMLILICLLGAASAEDLVLEGIPEGVEIEVINTAIPSRETMEHNAIIASVFFVIFLVIGIEILRLVRKKPVWLRFGLIGMGIGLCGCLVYPLLLLWKGFHVFVYINILGFYISRPIFLIFLDRPIAGIAALFYGILLAPIYYFFIASGIGLMYQKYLKKKKS